MKHTDTLDKKSLPAAKPHADTIDNPSLLAATLPQQLEPDVESDGRPALVCRVLCNRRLAFTLVVVAELLAVAWCIAVPFIVAADTLDSNYTFTPRSMISYIGWRIASGVIVAVGGVVAFCTLVGFLEVDAKSWRALSASFCVVFVILLLVGNLLAASETAARNHYENTFATKFNDFYCDTRTLLLCLEGNRDEILTLVRGNATTAQSTENPTDVALSVWGRCQELILENMADADEQLSAKEKQWGRMKGKKLVSTKPLYNFLKACNSSIEVDMWCGAANRISASTTEILKQQKEGVKNPMVHPAPYASNPKMFVSYTREWVRTMQFSNAFLGGAAACLFVASCILW